MGVGDCWSVEDSFVMGVCVKDVECAGIWCRLLTYLKTASSNEDWVSSQRISEGAASFQKATPRKRRKWGNRAIKMGFGKSRIEHV